MKRSGEVAVEIRRALIVTRRDLGLRGVLIICIEEYLLLPVEATL